MTTSTFWRTSNNEPTLQCVITAGGRVDGKFARESGTCVKALARVRGVSMLERAIAAARGAGATHVTIVGGSEVRAASAAIVDRVLDESVDGGQNVLRALGVAGSHPLLYLASDLPFVTASTLASFLDAVGPDTLAMPIASFADFEQRFPGAPGFGTTLGRERVVNGGVFMLPSGSAARVADVAAAFFTARKSSWAMARLLGPAMLLRYASGRLGVTTLEAYAAKRLGMPTSAIRGCAPELCYDCDTVEQYRYACSRV